MFRYGKIALGCSLSSALYCFYNQIPMIYVERRKVHPFEFFEPDTDLSLLKIEPLRYDLKMSDEGVAVFIRDAKKNSGIINSGGDYGSINTTNPGSIRCFGYPTSTVDQRAKLINFLKNEIDSLRKDI